MRLRELDGLRGLAAVQVMVSHFAILPNFIATPIDGAAAVILFFVLSGFVLSLPFFEGRPLHILDFYVRRLFRIYPAMLLSLALAVSLGFAAPWGDLLLQAISIYPGTTFETTNPVLWSLSVEIRYSLIIPALIILLANSRLSLRNVTHLGIVAVIAIYLVGESALWLMVFGFGALVAKYRQSIASWMNERPRRPMFLFGAATFGYFFASTFPGVYSYRLYCLMIAASSAGLIVSALNFPAYGKLLRGRIPTFLGFVSYSVYLFHYPLLKFATTKLSAWPYFGVVIVSCVATLIISFACAIIIERPAIAIGGVIARFVSGVGRAKPKIGSTDSRMTRVA